MAGLLKRLIPRGLARRSAERAAQQRRAELERQQQWALFNIKTLGYELARALTNKPSPPPPEQPVACGLRSKLCTQADIESRWFSFWCAEAGVAPVYIRKVWEFCFIAQALFEAGMLAPDRAGIAFGCGREPLPSLLAKYGCDILATDLRSTDPRAGRWGGADALEPRLAELRRADLCPDPERLAAVEFRWVDMTDIPRDLDGRFDFCWSSCAMEHLGGLAAGAEFVANSLRVLKPNGVAVHTTEFNLDDGDTLDTTGLALFQRRHIEALIERLRSAGQAAADPDFDAGDGLLDRFVDLPPWHSDLYPDPEFHLKVALAGYRCTSFGLIVRRGG